jgi:hypothetical protein
MVTGEMRVDIDSFLQVWTPFFIMVEWSWTLFIRQQRDWKAVEIDGWDPMSRLGRRNQKLLINDETDVRAGMIHLDELAGCLRGSWG